jgi:hypothetical protein
MKILAILAMLSLSTFLVGCDDDDSTSSSGGTGTVSVVSVENTTRESGRYHGRHNGDRPTWYFQRKMAGYPATFKVVVAGCADFTVSNNGHRYVYAGYIVKNSDVSGRGMALVAPSPCRSTSAQIVF